MSALSTFTDGVLVHQGQLNNLPTNIDALCQQTTGKTAAAGASTKPLLKVHLTASQSVPNNLDTFLNWGTTSVNSDGMWLGTAPVNRIIINTPGWYRIIAQATWVITGAGASHRVINIYANGTNDSLNVVSSFNTITGGVVVNNFRNQVCAYERLAAGTSLYIAVGHSIGSTTTVVSTPFGTWCAIRWDAPY
jgi:hypothetical protein